MKKLLLGLSLFLLPLTACAETTKTAPQAAAAKPFDRVLVITGDGW